MRLVQWSRFSDAFQRLFGLQGASQLNVVDDCFLTLPVEQELLHLANLRGWTPFALRLVTGPAVGQFSSCRISPSAGNFLVVEGVSVLSAGSVRVALAAALGGAGGVTPGFARDARRTLVGLVTATANNGAQVLPASSFTAPASVGATPYVPTIPSFVVTPGFDLVVEQEVANVQVSASFWGMYRELTQQEQ